MSKFSKKSLAALTAAAIMASTATITASAMSLTIPADLEVTSRSAVVTTNANFNGRAGDDLTWTTPEGKVVKINGKVAASPYLITSDDETNGITMTVEEATSAGGAENTDGILWINGKDTKAKGETPASLYKSESYDVVMMSAGCKWQVAVAPADIDTVDKFAALVDDKGKFDSETAKATKKIASAKVKDGTVTVTAGKEAGQVKVWVYEVKNKALLNDGTVVPKCSETYTVKVASTMTVTTEATTVADGAIAKIDNPKGLEKTGYVGGTELTVYFGDKKNPVSTDSKYVLWDSKGKKEAELKEGKLVGEGFTAELVQATATTAPYVKITIAADAKVGAKIDVQVMCVESQKVAKIATKVKAAETTGGSEGEQQS